MSKKSHTPGPWVSRNNMVFGGKKCICSNVNSASQTPQNIAEDVAMSIANARLIAAAPELLDALVNLLPLISPLKAESQQVADASAAIAKATA
ncbi:TPA: hypothetical protein L5Q84_006611 [Pseudomonas aeruginosa]|uniref:hypothetical protein n=1 Tax=Pseudomonas aeruginosa TaxID=287 RepID=UPI000FFBCA28|nr:hypothetical protein [Pseudomonas aeruginosa]EKY0461267.1 hypothetical protein [Pseudomonas aeruginosa]MBG6522798.1 hypothetical protein [Pseudomonas aeruginosa]MBV5905156.1 hypothetical protein [Pseudomonas aeruginosa]MBV6179318.1 hypothetical protein [Pseudomonas aeruginosa]MCO1960724.1 hypothetical protein [Pseudomonas aeruginosa]